MSVNNPVKTVGHLVLVTNPVYGCLQKHLMKKVLQKHYILGLQVNCLSRDFMLGIWFPTTIMICFQSD